MNCRASLSFLLTLAAAGHAQGTRTLGPIAGSAPEPFSSISGVHELPDGRLLVSDARETALRLVDLVQGTALLVSREGGGPTEYRSVGRLFAWAGDSVAMYDRSAERFLVLTGDGRPIRTFRVASHLAYATHQPGRGDIRFLGQDGRILAQSAAVPVVDQGRTAPDSGPVVRFDPQRNRTDTVAMVRLSGLVQRPTSEGTSINIGAVANPFRTQDAWAAFSNGRVVVLRSGDFSVEWISSSGARTRGPATPYAPVRVTSADRELIQRMGVSLGGGRAVPVAPEMLTDLPPVKPAFDHRTIVADPVGAVWVQRFRAAADSVPVYDVFDERGLLTARVRLPFGSRVVAISPQHVYVARTDEDGLEWLTRHRR